VERNNLKLEEKKKYGARKNKGFSKVKNYRFNHWAKVARNMGER